MTGLSKTRNTCPWPAERSDAVEWPIAGNGLGFFVTKSLLTCSVLWRVKQSMWVFIHVFFLGDFMSVCWMKKTEYLVLDFYERKSSLMDSISKQRNQVYWTRFSNAVVRFSSNPESSKRRRNSGDANPAADSDQTQPAKASGDVKCRDRMCLIAATMQKRWSFRRRDDAKTMKLQAPGFGPNRRLGFIAWSFRSLDFLSRRWALWISIHRNRF